ncbi:hypothetical protein ACT4MC_24435 (plasmid) [Vibrio furnissii]
MTVMLWVKMPSDWIRNDVLKESFSGSNKVSEDIAALKLYLVICLLAKEVKRPFPHSDFLGLGKPMTRTVLECAATYDVFSEMCSLSRSLVCRGLSKLKKTRLIDVEGGRRTKRYIVLGSPERFWCKLPKRALVHNEETIPMFLQFLNRYQYERSALKIYMYILASRTNSKQHVDLSRRVISKKTGVPMLQIDGALGFLQSVGLMAKVEKKSFLLSSDEAVDENRIHRYWVTGHEGLYYRTIKFDADDYYSMEAE